MIALIVWAACIFAAAMIAKNKGRPIWEGILWGLFLGIFGVIIELCMRTKVPVAPAVPLTAVPGPCKHWHATQVRGNDELVAWLCTDCHTQLPATWAIPA